MAEVEDEEDAADEADAKPALVGGYLGACPPVFGASGVRVFVPCGQTGFCFSVKTLAEVGQLPPGQGRTTALCSGPAREGCSDPIACGSSAGEVRIFDGRTRALLAILKAEHPVFALKWPKRDLIYVVFQSEEPEIRRIDVSVLNAPRLLSHKVPIGAKAVIGFDAVENVLAVLDNHFVSLWVEGWTRERVLSTSGRTKLVNLTIDPLLRYVSVGDAKGVVWTWWGVFNSMVDDQTSPARWHWHSRSGGVHALAHSGPVQYSGGEEGVLVQKQVEEEIITFIPRFQAAIAHIAGTPDGMQVCLFLADNSLWMVDWLKSSRRMRQIAGIGLPHERLNRNEQPGGWVFHQLTGGGLAATGKGREVQFLSERARVIDYLTIKLRKGNVLPMTKVLGAKAFTERWLLTQMAISVDLLSMMTCESRISPSLRDFDRQIAGSYCIRWWCRENTSEQFMVRSITTTAHLSEVSVLLAHPVKPKMFISASHDGSFKCWDLPAAVEDEAEGNPQRRSWQCISTGTWRQRPVVCGCLSTDGACLSLGVRGQIVLWEPEKALELGTLAHEREELEASQLYCSTMSGHLLLLAMVIDGSKKEDNPRRRSLDEAVVIWDLVHMERVLKVDVSATLRGRHRCILRMQPPELSEGPGWIFLAYRPNEACQIWHFNEGQQELGDDPFEKASVAFESEDLPQALQGKEVIDICFHGSMENSLLCWTSQLETITFPLPARGRGKRRKPKRKALQAQYVEPGSVPDEEQDVEEQGALGRMLGGQVAKDKAPKRALFHRPLRTTVAQQVGIAPHLLQHIIPSHAPSHTLPTPAAIWAGLVSVYGKPYGQAAAGDAIEGGTKRSAESAEAAPARPAKRQRVVEAPLQTVDIGWMDMLVKEAFEEVLHGSPGTAP